MTDQQMESASTSQNSNRVVVRRPDFEFNSESISRFYFRNNGSLTHLLSCVNVQISVLETLILNDCSDLLFCNAVRDPTVRRELAELIQQEAIHGAMHSKFNEVLRSQGYPIGWARRLMSERFAWLQGESQMLRMAVGVAGECFFAVTSRLVLARPSFTQGLDPAVKALVLWHCYEELEHKSVGINAYNDAFGRTWRSYLTRLRALWILLRAFLETGFEIRREFRRVDKRKITGKEHRELLRFMLTEPAVLLRVTWGMLSFLNPWFDAWKSRHTDDLERYRSTAVRDEWAVTPRRTRMRSSPEL